MKTYRIFFLDHRSCYLNSLGDALAQCGNQIFYQTSWNMEEIEAGLSYFKPQILLTVGCDKPLHDSTLNSLPEICKKYNLTHVYWATEDKIHHDDWSLPFVRRINPDLVWTIHPECVRSYQKQGFPASYLNFAFNPRVFPEKPYTSNEIFDISLVGSTHMNKKTYRYDSLNQLLFPFIRKKQKVHIWGFGWKEEKSWVDHQFGVDLPFEWMHGFLPYKRTAEIYHQSKIMLGVQNAHDQVTQRTFEILGTGSLMIASKTEELSRLFTHGLDIILVDDPKETLELTDYYLRHSEERKKIGKKAREKILKFHTFSQRLPRIWTQLESIVENRRGV